MPLILRSVKGTKLTIQEMDDNLVYLEELAKSYPNLGLTGPQGYQGFTGPQGMGPTGSNGITGTQGNTGPQGFQGMTGPEGGPQGPTGVDGQQGPIGPTGDQGDIGPIGPVGDQGEQGPRGYQGYQGDIGPVGSLQDGVTFKFSDGSNAITFDGLTISNWGSIVPIANYTYDLGTTESRWNNIFVKDIFMASQSIYLGSLKLSDTNGSLTIQTIDQVGDPIDYDLGVIKVVDGYAVSEYPILSADTNYGTSQFFVRVSATGSPDIGTNSVLDIAGNGVLSNSFVLGPWSEDVPVSASRYPRSRGGLIKLKPRGSKDLSIGSPGFGPIGSTALGETFSAVEVLGNGIVSQTFLLGSWEGADGDITTGFGPTGSTASGTTFSAVEVLGDGVLSNSFYLGSWDEDVPVTLAEERRKVKSNTRPIVQRPGVYPIGSTGSGATVSGVDLGGDFAISDSFVLGSWDEDVPVTLATVRKSKSNNAATTQQVNPGIYPVGSTASGATVSGVEIGGDFIFGGSMVLGPWSEDVPVTLATVRKSRSNNAATTLQVNPGVYPVGSTASGATVSGTEIGGDYIIGKSYILGDWSDNPQVDANVRKSISNNAGTTQRPGIFATGSTASGTTFSAVEISGDGLVSNSFLLGSWSEDVPVTLAGGNTRGFIKLKPKGSKDLSIGSPGFGPIGSTALGETFSAVEVLGNGIVSQTFLLGSWEGADGDITTGFGPTGSTASGTTFSAVEVLGDGVLSNSFYLGSWSEDVPVTFEGGGSRGLIKIKPKGSKDLRPGPGVYPTGSTASGETFSGVEIGGDGIISQTFLLGSWERANGDITTGFGPTGSTSSGTTFSAVEVLGDGVLSNSFVLGSWSEDVPVTLAGGTSRGFIKLKPKGSKDLRPGPGFGPIGSTSSGETFSAVEVRGDGIVSQTFLIGSWEGSNGDITTGFGPTGSTASGTTASAVEVLGDGILSNSFLLGSWSEDVPITLAGGLRGGLIKLKPKGSKDLSIGFVPTGTTASGETFSAVGVLGDGIYTRSVQFDSWDEDVPVTLAGGTSRGFIKLKPKGSKDLSIGFVPTGSTASGETFSAVEVKGDGIVSQTFLLGSWQGSNGDITTGFGSTGSTASGATFSAVEVLGDGLVTEKLYLGDLTFPVDKEKINYLEGTSITQNNSLVYKAPTTAIYGPTDSTPLPDANEFYVQITDTNLNGDPTQIAFILSKNDAYGDRTIWWDDVIPPTPFYFQVPIPKHSSKRISTLSNKKLKFSSVTLDTLETISIEYPILSIGISDDESSYIVWCSTPKGGKVYLVPQISLNKKYTFSILETLPEASDTKLYSRTDSIDWADTGFSASTGFDYMIDGGSISLMYNFKGATAPWIYDLKSLSKYRDVSLSLRDTEDDDNQIDFIVTNIEDDTISGPSGIVEYTKIDGYIIDPKDTIPSTTNVDISIGSSTTVEIKPIQDNTLAITQNNSLVYKSPTTTIYGPTDSTPLPDANEFYVQITDTNLNGDPTQIAFILSRNDAYGDRKIWWDDVIPLIPNHIQVPIPKHSSTKRTSSFSNKKLKFSSISLNTNQTVSIEYPILSIGDTEDESSYIVWCSTPKGGKVDLVPQISQSKKYTFSILETLPEASDTKLYSRTDSIDWADAGFSASTGFDYTIIGASVSLEFDFKGATAPWIYDLKSLAKYRDVSMTVRDTEDDDNQIDFIVTSVSDDVITGPSGIVELTRISGTLIEPTIGSWSVGATSISLGSSTTFDYRPYPSIQDLRIASASNDDTLDKILVWDSADTKRVRYRNASSLTGVQIADLGFSLVSKYNLVTSPVNLGNLNNTDGDCFLYGGMAEFTMSGVTGSTGNAIITNSTGTVVMRADSIDSSGKMRFTPTNGPGLIQGNENLIMSVTGGNFTDYAIEQSPNFLRIYYIYDPIGIV
jgi:hypothetical protein